MRQFKWTEQKTNVALGLAEGKSQVKVAEECGIDRTTIIRWLKDPEFSEEVDRLTLITDIATRAERLRLAKRVVKELTKDDKIITSKDLLDWLKYAQSETDGIRLDLAAFDEAKAQLAGGGQDSPAENGA